MNQGRGSDDPTLRVGDSPGASPGFVFSPGTVVADRYRIVDLLGSGGMGEVYRADDLRLEQSVALKFLPPALSSDPSLIARLRQEVRLGRTISHPNVCRIYDIGEADGATFIAMEHVRGEDLSSLLRRIGRFPEDKALEISRQLCSGLSAVHARGVLHRDLKPANVMLDQDGHVRLTDFGLALPLSEGNEYGVLAGTPAYMAPEQLRGERLSEQSDIYSLGLILYEVFTGQRLRSGNTLHELSRTASPATSGIPLHPRVTETIAACLAESADDRPKSAIEVLRSLPGGDPLAEALAAGVTPSPDAVAAAPRQGRLHPLAGWMMFAAVVAGVAGIVALQMRHGAAREVGLRSPLLVEERIAELMRELGVGEGDGIEVLALTPNPDAIAWSAANPHHSRIRARELEFAYRVYPIASRADDLRQFSFGDLPPVSGSMELDFDAAGRLVSYRIVGSSDAFENPAGGLDPLFRAAEIDAGQLEPTEPRLVPTAWADQRVAWTGRDPDGAALRIEAALRGSLPVHFVVEGPWQNEPADRGPAMFGTRAFAYVAGIGFGLLILAGAALAWLNTRRRRIDAPGTWRLFGIVFLLTCVGFLLQEPHPGTLLGELGTLFAGVQAAVISAVIFALIYMAVEPVVRRRWPELMISWTRALHGGFRDPLVARDILIGTAGGALHASLPYLLAFAVSARPPAHQGVVLLSGLDTAVGGAAVRISNALFQGLIAILVLGVLLVVFRSRVVAMGALFGIVTFFFSVAYVGGMAHPVLMALVMASMLTAVLRVSGPLGIAAMQATFFLVFHAPIGPHASWAVPMAMINLVIIGCLAIYGLVVSTGLRESLATRLDSIG